MQADSEHRDGLPGLSSAQRWYARIYTGWLRNHAVMSFQLDVPHPVSDEALDAALWQLLTRHDSLRMGFADSPGALFPRVAERAGLPGAGSAAEARPAGILSHPPVAGGLHQARATAADLAMTQSAAGIPVLSAPLLRGVAVRGDAYGTALSIVTHHFIFDGVSKSLFCADLLEQLQLPGPAAAARPDAPSYGEFCRWSLAHEQGASGVADRSYWEQALTGFGQPCRLPRPHGPPRRPATDDAVIDVAGQARITLPAGLRAAARTTASSLRVSDFAVRATAFLALCHALYALDDVIIMMPVDMRYHYRGAPAIGMHVNFVPIRHELKHAETVAECIRSTAAWIVRGFRHGGYALDRIAASTCDANYSGHFPLSSALINSEQLAIDSNPIAPDPVIESTGRAVAFDLQLYLTESSERTDVVLQYNPRAVAPALWSNLITSYVSVVSVMCARPQDSFEVLLRGMDTLQPRRDET